MTDTITPAVAHRVLDALEQSGHIGPDGSLSALFIVRDAVKAWEAEAAREVEVLQLAKRLVQEEFGGYNQWHDLSTSEQERRIQYVKFILAFLAADGRLLPEGGTVLTAEQWEAAHPEPCSDCGHTSDCSLHNGPAVPAGPCDCGGIYPTEWRVYQGDQRDDAASGEATTEWGVQFPTGVVMPCASQERADRVVLQGWGKPTVVHRRILTPPADPVPDGGPDGTPEKPWPTWQDVPEGVVYRGARDTSGWDGWFNRGGARHRFFDGALSKNSEAMIADEAPFVRVDGDKA